MRYVLFLLILNIVFVIGALVLNMTLASGYESNVAEYTPIADSIDALISNRRFEAALQEIDTHVNSRNPNAFQEALAARKVMCLAQLNRHTEAKAVIDSQHRNINGSPVYRTPYPTPVQFPSGLPFYLTN